MLPFLIFAIATAVSVALGAVVRRTAPAIGAVVPPRPDRWHNAPTPTMGGVAIAAATVVPSAASARAQASSVAPVVWTSSTTIAGMSASIMPAVR